MLSSAFKHPEKQNLLQLSMDGPSVNCNVLDKISEKRSEFEQLLVIGNCSQHVLHGVFKNGVTITKWDLGKILKSMLYLFYDSQTFICVKEKLMYFH